MGTLTPSELAAWYAAAVATIVFVWDIFKWLKSGPKLNVTIMPEILVMPDPVNGDDARYIGITVTNVGDKPTTIKGVGLILYQTWFKRCLRKGGIHMIIPNLHYAKGSFPHVLEVGNEWTANVMYNSDMKKWAKDKILYATFNCSHTTKLIKKRVKIST